MDKNHQISKTRLPSSRVVRDISNQEAPAQPSSFVNLDDLEHGTGCCVVCKRHVAARELNKSKFCTIC